MTLPPSELPCHQGAVKRAIRYRTVSIAAALVVGGFIALVACSNQGEGERCEIANGDDDCKTDEDLICYKAESLNVKVTSSARCCPRDRSKATHPACLTPVEIVDATAPSDTGPSITPDAAVANPDAMTTDAEADAAEAGDGG